MKPPTERRHPLLVLLIMAVGFSFTPSGLYAQGGTVTASLAGKVVDGT